MVLHTIVATGDQAFDHAVVDIRRVSRTVKGGRRFRFRATVLVGNKNGIVALGLGKGKDVPGAINKAQTAARKRLVAIARRGGTIPHAVTGRFGGAQVLLKPAPAGTGVIAGGAIRSLASLAGIQDLSSKSFGSRNVVNVVQATLRALASLKVAHPARS